MAAAQQAPDTTRDRAELVALEHTWLHAQDAATLDRILAPDFVHPVASGGFLTKAQHIAWVVGHPRPASTRVGFESLTVRLYGDAAVANGAVMARPVAGRPVRTVFTDVFVRRGGRWQAVNAQENFVGGR
ncbi:MAG TPA: nuclear transport factor 2 family protein [Gemmatimonadales bacterium]|nr:nuclear transport factor 2 family protein [Gemmatimonadales bacterium]